MDGLDEPDYDPVAHLNVIFPAGSNLARVPELQDHLALYQCRLDREQSEPIELSSDEQHALDTVQNTPNELQQLIDEVGSLKTRAAKSEQNITEMTADIKRLDRTKANLVKSVTVLRRLQMLTNAYDQLVLLVNNRQYKEMSQTLPAVTELMTHFKSFRSIQQVATLSRNIAEIQTSISDQIFKDFAGVIESREPSSRRSSMNGPSNIALADACKVLDSLTGNFREQLIQWYCNVQLKEYRQIFQCNDEAGSLENISRRYGHFKRILKRHNDELGQFFASDWPVAVELAKSFCSTTKDDIQFLLKQAGRNVNVQLLLTSLEETLEFEQFLEKRVKKGEFDKALSVAFQPHLNIWIEHQDKVLTQKFAQFKAPPQPSDEDEEEEPTVLPSSADLFVFYKQTLAQTAKLSTGPPLLDLANLFAKWLSIYSNQILRAIVPPRIASEDDLKTVCLALNTADYCRTTTDQLCQRIVEKLDENQREHVNLDEQMDSFTNVVNLTIAQLVQKVEAGCDYAWREMVNTNWSKLDVPDQSGYVSELRRVIESESRQILNTVHKDLHVRMICDRIVDTVTSTFLYKMVQCKPISPVAAEQMLLDLCELETCFKSLPTLRKDYNVSSTFERHYKQSLKRVELVLKVIMSSTEPAEALVQTYFYCIKDASPDNFVKILQFKGIPKQDWASFVESFYSHLKAHDDLAEHWPTLTNLRMNEPPSTHSQTLPNSLTASHAGSQPHSRVPSVSSFGHFTSQNAAANLFDNLTKEGFERFAQENSVNKLNENFRRLFRREGNGSPVNR